MTSADRRLAAIVVADVVGYSLMMAEDEDATLSALRAHRTAIDPVILNHGGRIVKGTGDGLIVEFPSATAALEAAVAVQALMSARNHEIPESRRMSFRIGVNLGDVVVDETGDIFGDGVNVAARVEATADPGGVSATTSVREAVRGKVDFGFVDDGEHELKNIPTPIRLWKVRTASAPATRPTTQPDRRLATVAVLPMVNVTGDPDQDYFSDGLTEDLLTALSYDRDLAVVARNSVFAYKGRAVGIRTIARELDATHVVEGSVRRSGGRVRVSAQLVDAETGHHVWAERYDRDLGDIFELQDDLVEAIIAQLRPTLRESVASRVSREGARSIDAWDLTLRGQFHLNTYTAAGFLRAIELFGEARRLEPDLVATVAGTAMAWLFLAHAGWRTEDVNPWQRGAEEAETAYRLDRNDYAALGALSVVRSTTGRPDDGARLARRMIELNPYARLGPHMLGNNLDKAGEHDASIVPLTKAWRLGRHDPLRFDIANDLAHSHYMAGGYEPAISWGLQSLSSKDDYLLAHIVLAAAYGRLGRTEEARPHVEAVLASRPGFRSGRHRSRLAYVRDEDRDLLIEGLVEAGLPD